MSVRAITEWRGFHLALLMLAVCGCDRTPENSLETLPWSNVSQASNKSTLGSDTTDVARSPAPVEAGELQFRDYVVQECLPELRRIAKESVLLAAVQKANSASWQSQQQIEQIDAQWRQTQGVDDPLIQKYLKNPCADMLRLVQRSNPKFVELFVMDNKGCIVAESVKTSDFWQGDEEKWTKCFNGGNGRIFVGDVEYDQSTRSYVVQISLPIHDQQQVTIGAMTASVSSGFQN